MQATAKRVDAKTRANQSASSAGTTALFDERPRGGGVSLDENVMANMESNLGHSFSDVRVHDDASSHKQAHFLGAHAFAAGGDIYFGKGERNTTSPEGLGLIAHELTHVAQQEQTGGQTLQMCEYSTEFGQAKKLSKEKVRELKKKIDKKYQEIEKGAVNLGKAGESDQKNILNQLNLAQRMMSGVKGEKVTTYFFTTANQILEQADFYLRNARELKTLKEKDRDYLKKSQEMKEIARSTDQNIQELNKQLKDQTAMIVAQERQATAQEKQAREQEKQTVEQKKQTVEQAKQTGIQKEQLGVQKGQRNLQQGQLDVQKQQCDIQKEQLVAQKTQAVLAQKKIDKMDKEEAEEKRQAEEEKEAIETAKKLKDAKEEAVREKVKDERLKEDPEFTDAREKYYQSKDEYEKCKDEYFYACDPDGLVTDREIKAKKSHEEAKKALEDAEKAYEDARKKAPANIHKIFNEATPDIKTQFDKSWPRSRKKIAEAFGEELTENKYFSEHFFGETDGPEAIQEQFEKLAAREKSDLYEKIVGDNEDKLNDLAGPGTAFSDEVFGNPEQLFAGEEKSKIWAVIFRQYLTDYREDHKLDHLIIGPYIKNWFLPGINYKKKTLLKMEKAIEENSLKKSCKRTFIGRKSDLTTEIKKALEGKSGDGESILRFKTHEDKSPNDPVANDQASDDRGAETTMQMMKDMRKIERIRKRIIR